MIVLTFYSRLYHHWKSEHNTVQLVRLDSDFFTQSKNYLNHLKSQSEHKDPLISELFQRRSARAIYLVEDILRLRMKKHFDDNLNNVNSSEWLTNHDTKFKSKLEEIVDEFKNNILSPENIEPVEERAYYLAHITKSVENMGIDVDLLDYGPFYSGDLVYIPLNKIKKIQATSSGKIISED